MTLTDLRTTEGTGTTDTMIGTGMTRAVGRTDTTDTMTAESE
jgi:hypothetical protein